MTGLCLRAPDGAYLVDGAHIQPVQLGGPDSVRNGIALARTVHEAFDLGLLSIDDDYRILISRSLRDRKFVSLLNQDGRIILPKGTSLHPHPSFLRFHRENIFVP